MKDDETCGQKGTRCEPSQNVPSIILSTPVVSKRIFGLNKSSLWVKLVQGVAELYERMPRPSVSGINAAKSGR